MSAQIRELNLAQVHVVGSVDDARLAAMFRRAVAFVTVSEHEGFCVPLLESLAFDVPGHRACVRRDSRDPRRGRAPAPGVGGRRAHRGRRSTRLVEDADLRNDLILRGRRRLQELVEIDASVAMLEAIGEIV